ncbi:MAG TPA: hypothetical protein VH519_07075 [Hyphomicrobiaceae bacterium]|jgi:hypothetical protein
MARLDGNGVALACANRSRDRDPGYTGCKPELTRGVKDELGA